MTNSTSPRIYVASLADYNAGNLHGVWIDADQDEDQIKEEIAAMLRASKHPNVSVQCPTCEGTGRDPLRHDVPAVSCDTCNGTGRVPSAEEWAIHDHEGFEGIKIGEHASIEDVARHAEMLAEHDGAWAAYVGNVGEHYATEEGFTDSYCGEYNSAEEYAEELATECGYLEGGDKNPLLNYIDWERFARDLSFGDYNFVDGGRGVYVFRNV